MSLLLRQMTSTLAVVKMSRVANSTATISIMSPINSKVHFWRQNYFSTSTSNGNKIKVNFRRANGQVLIGYGKEGDSLLDVVVNNNLDLDGFGACEGTLACSTCHLILKKEDYDRLPKKPLDEELDMLDLAYGLTDTSRLGCQIYLTKDMEDMAVQVPEGVNDVRS